MKKITNKTLWIFAIGQLGWSLLSGIITSWLVYYYTDAELILEGYPVFITQETVFIGLTVIGVITAVSRIFDAITDPIIAGKSDNCWHKDGRRIPFMRVAAIPLGIVTALVFFSPVQGISWANNIFLFMMLILFYAFLTIYCTPYNALIPELGKTQKDRVNLSTFISLAYIVGTSVAFLVPNIASLLEVGLEKVWAVRTAIIVLALIATVCMLIPVFFLKEREYIDVEPSKVPMFKSLFKTFKNKQFRRFVYSDIIYFFAVTLFQTGLAFYVTRLMGLDDTMTFILMVIMTICSLALYIPVNKLTYKFGKKKIIIFGFFFYAGVFALTTLCGLFGISGIVWGVSIAILAGAPMAILGILPQAVVADIAEADEIESGEKREGMFFAARTFAMKLGQAISMLVFTSITVLSTSMSYRVTAIVSTVTCLLGATIFFFYNEKSVMAKISSMNESNTDNVDCDTNGNDCD